MSTTGVKKLDVALKELRKMFLRGATAPQMRAYLQNQKIDQWLWDDMVKSTGETETTINEDSGESAGMSRRDRPKHTKKILIVLLISYLVKARKEVAKFKAKPRPGAVVGGVKVPASFSRLWRNRDKPGAKLDTPKKQAGAVQKVIGDLLEKITGRKLMNKAGYISNRYLENEMRSIKWTLYRKRKIALGFTWCFIPLTEKGHLDECREYENRWYRIGVDTLPELPIHINCKHRYVFRKAKKL